MIVIYSLFDPPIHISMMSMITSYNAMSTIDNLLVKIVQSHNYNNTSKNNVIFGFYCRISIVVTLLEKK